jgi:hypothetical protein
MPLTYLPYNWIFTGKIYTWVFHFIIKQSTKIAIIKLSLYYSVKKMGGFVLRVVWFFFYINSWLLKDYSGAYLSF